SGATVSGVDASAEMIELAKQTYPTIHFEQKDASQLDYNREFDAVFSNATFHWIENQKGLLRGIYKGLKHGGRLVAEFGGKGNVKGITDAIELAAKNLGLASKLTKDFWFFPSISEYTTLLEKNNFEVNQALIFDRPTPLKGINGMRDWIMQFAPYAFKNMNHDEIEAIIDAVIEIVKPTHFIRDQWVADYKRIRIKATKNER
ncbi:MAG: class I SAM-dependent methyltransferase, partial [Flavobacterium sp.]